MLKKRYLIAIIIALIVLTSTGILSPTRCGSVEYVPVLDTNSEPLTNSSTLKLISYNIHYGYGYTNAEKSEAEVKAFLDDIANIIKDADIVNLQEVDRNVGRSHRLNQAQYLAKKAGFPYYLFADDWNIKLLPYTPTFRLRFARTGHTILSKYPITNYEASIYKKSRASLLHKMFFIWRSQQFVDIDINGTDVRVFNVHLESESNIDRMDQANQLVEKIKASPYPVIALGDFNTLRPEATNRDFPAENYEDDDTMERFVASKLKPAFPSEIYTKNESEFFTFPSRDPDRQLDYAFYSPDLELISAKPIFTEKTKESSDHLPIELEFRLK